MKSGYTKLVVTAAIVSLFIVAWSPAAAAQSCPSSPKYLPDFTSNQNCMVLNGILDNTPEHNLPGLLSSGSVTTSWSDNGAATHAEPEHLGGDRLVRHAATGFWSVLHNVHIPEWTGANALQCGDVSCPGDGIAFVIQNSSSSAIGPQGCGHSVLASAIFACHYYRSSNRDPQQFSDRV